MRFSRFMELALYDPLEGYYASGRAAVGRAGDFFTSVSLGPVFGELLAGQFLEMWETLGRPSDFTLVEQGANDGRLAADILDALAGTPLADIRLLIVEPFTPLREAQQKRLSGRRVEWADSPAALPPFTGVHFSNELFDALPVDLLEARDGHWKNLRVIKNGTAFELAPAESIETHWPSRPDGFRKDRFRRNLPLDLDLTERHRLHHEMAQSAAERVEEEVCDELNHDHAAVAV
jgi:SAM-dependent MidA family methyltransferase